MAGQEIVKSSKSSFMSGSPKPKQASILNFFGAQKQQPPIISSPLSQTAEDQPIYEDIENIAPECFDEPLHFSETETVSKKPCILDTKSIFRAKTLDDSTVLAPKILTQLNLAANSDFDHSDPSYGRYSWLADVKDINGKKRGN